MVGPPSARNSKHKRSASADCPSGKNVIGGAYKLKGANSGNVTPVKEVPIGSSSWKVTAVESSKFGSKWSLQAIAICATAQ